jgi:hypothetical protein
MYHEGNKSTVVTTLGNLKIVNEDSLEWEQVQELRSDSQTRDNYRRFFHWLDKEMIGKSQAFIEDEISNKLSDYEEALKKHGIKTIIGTLKEILDGNFLFGTGAIAGITAFASEPILGIFAEAGLIIAKLSISIAEKKLDYEEIEKGPNSEISWVYEVNKLANKRAVQKSNIIHNQNDSRQLQIERARAAFYLIRYYYEGKLYEKSEQKYQELVDIVEKTNAEVIEVNDFFVLSTMIVTIKNKDIWLNLLDNPILNKATENLSKKTDDILQGLIKISKKNKK